MSDDFTLVPVPQLIRLDPDQLFLGPRIATPRPLGLHRVDIADAVHRQAVQRPDAPAFLHKRHGQWQLFPWSFVGHEVNRLAVLMGLSSPAVRPRLALSGAYEPGLLMLALAALSRGGAVVAVDPGLQGEALAHTLAAIAPTHVHVQTRRSLARWSGVARLMAGGVPLFTAHTVAADARGWKVVPLRDPAPGAPPRDGRRPFKLPALTWVEEGTEWDDGLKRIIERAIDWHATLAFPETPAANVRDRRELQPGTLLLSPAGRDRLVRDDRARRAPEGSLTRRLVDGAEAAPKGTVARLVNRRRLAVLGFGRAADARSPRVLTLPA